MRSNRPAEFIYHSPPGLGRGRFPLTPIVFVETKFSLEVGDLCIEFRQLLETLSELAVIVDGFGIELAQYFAAEHAHRLFPTLVP